MSDSLRPHGNLQARILKRVAFPFSRGPSQSRDWTQVSRITGGFFTSWATREAPLGLSSPLNHKSVTYLFWQGANLDVTWSVGITWSAARVEDSRALYTSCGSSGLWSTHQAPWAVSFSAAYGCVNHPTNEEMVVQRQARGPPDQGRLNNKQSPRTWCPACLTAKAKFQGVWRPSFFPQCPVPEWSADQSMGFKKQHFQMKQVFISLGRDTVFKILPK